MVRLNRLNSESVINAIQSENVFSASMPHPVPGAGCTPETCQPARVEEVANGTPSTGNLALNGAPGMTTAEIKATHPSAADVFRLWQIFLDNVNPITKLVHAPTMQRQLFESMRNPESNSKEWDVMLFAIYLAAIQSMSRHGVQDTFGETKEVFLRRYQMAIRAALVRVDFTNTSDLLIVQAFVLYLVSTSILQHPCPFPLTVVEQSIREYTEPNSLWILTGIGLRLAQRLGLHRDGSNLGISPFETEIRRRVWWNLVGLDSRTAESCGAGLSSNPPKGDTKHYLNVNDSDLSPTMSVPPQEHEGATEMIFCKFQSAIGHFLRNSKECALYHITGVPQQAAQTQSFEELEATCQNKYLKHCDPSVPLHLFTLLLGRATLMVLRLIVRHPRSFGMTIPNPSTAKEREDMWTICTKILEMYNNTLETESIQQYLWYVNVHFQWHAFVIVTHELCHRTAGDEADKGWLLIERLFDHNPDVLTNKNTGLHKAVLRLVLKAWAARARGLQKAGKQYEVPKFVAILQSQAPSASQGEKFVTTLPGGAGAYIGDPQSIQKEMQPPKRDYAGAMSTPESGTTDFLTTPIDWNEWDNLLSGFEYQTNSFMDPYHGG